MDLLRRVDVTSDKGLAMLIKLIERKQPMSDREFFAYLDKKYGAEGARVDVVFGGAGDEVQVVTKEKETANA